MATTPWADDILGKDIAVGGSVQSPRRKTLNYIQGTGVVLSIADNPANGSTDVTIAASGSLTGGFDYKDSVRVATTANITLSGTQTIDGIAAIAGDRVLVWQQTTASQNGIYVVSAGAWSRATDANTNQLVTSGMIVYVSEGTLYGKSAFRLTTIDTIALGTTGLTFERNPRTIDDVLSLGNTANNNPFIAGNSQYFQRGTTAPAANGQLRFSNTDRIRWRNAANTSQSGIELDASDNLVLGGGGFSPTTVQMIAASSVDVMPGGNAAHRTYAIFPNYPGLVFQPSYGDGTGGAAFLSVDVPTTARAGMDLWISAGGGGTGNQNGGNLRLYAGYPAGTGTVGGVQVMDSLTSGTQLALFVNDATPRLELDVKNLVWGSGVSTPLIWQSDQSAASTAGQKLTIHAQNAIGATSTGGALDIGPGSGTTAGGLARLISGSASARVSWNDTGLGFYGATPVSKPSYGVASATRQMQIDALFSALSSLGLLTDNRTSYADNPFVSVSSPTTTGNITVNTIETIGTLAAGITRTLPAAPSTGDWYRVNAGPSAATFNVTIARNGKTIDGASADDVLNTAYQKRFYVYNGTEWRTMT